MPTPNSAEQLAEHAELRAAVQHNCHISDATHAGNYTLCVYLMKMREYYRWEMGYGYAERLSAEAVGDWLHAREALWEELEEESFRPLPLGERELDPFDADAVNARLHAAGLVYSAGIGLQGKAHFFLGRLERQEQHHGFTLLVAGDEYARDLTAPPAMSLGKTVFIRRQSLRRMIWERVEEWRWNRLDNPMGRALAHYDFEADPEGSLTRMADREVDSLLLHEIGEVEAGRRLGPGWEAMLADLPPSRLELLLRAVRDNLADALSTLPGLLDHGRPDSLHFYVAGLSNLRKALAPTLIAAYQDWHDSGRDTALREAAEAGREHWQGVAEAALQGYAAAGHKGIAEIEALIDRSTL
ncbi:hypothetical protein QVG61_07335 [Thiohalobacter sp. IOR34]|uniref:Sfum_1244 family protein n=1 Tax=Thiohalobacter sp. IOR34 TaxID=3057176 RepID=UPI0025B1D52E|nr:Sfum_1244 family protein [Thiohalobacter sp. IOR34]WJW74333.1 hypothetical protein QVG61_07335 [Thiohalobacter sp. IOR34]